MTKRLASPGMLTSDPGIGGHIRVIIGMATKRSPLGIHLDPEAVMISTPLDKYEGDADELAEGLAREAGLDCSKKKNRTIFPKDDRLIELLGLRE